MKIVDTGRRDIVEMRGGGGWLMLFGLPFFLVGFGVLGLSLGFFAGQEGPPLPVGLLFGTVFGLVGTLMILGRQGCLVDCQRGTLTSWWGLLVPLHKKERSLAEFDCITITKEIRRSNKNTYVVYPVKITGVSASVKVHEYRDYEKSRALAEQVAKALHLPIHDSSSGTEIVREADKLDESLRDRMHRLGQVPELPQAPAEMKSRILSKDRAIMIQIPPQGFLATHIIILIGAFLGVGVVIVFFGIAMQEVPREMLYFMVPFLGLFMILPLTAVFGGVVKPATVAHKVIVSPNTGLRLESQGLMMHKMVEIPVDELEELILPQNSVPGNNIPPAIASALKHFGKQKSAIIARGDNQTVLFGEQLSDAEKRYIHDLICYTITQ